MGDRDHSDGDLNIPRPSSEMDQLQAQGGLEERELARSNGSLCTAAMCPEALRKKTDRQEENDTS